MILLNLMRKKNELKKFQNHAKDDGSSPVHWCYFDGGNYCVMAAIVSFMVKRDKAPTTPLPSDGYIPEQ